MATRKLSIPIGARYGLLEAIGPEATIRAKSSMTCRCDCGAIKIVPCSELNTGGTKSCGCGRVAEKHKNLIGKKFGSLTVTRDSYGTEGWSKYVLCSCECGNTEYQATRRNLVSGRLVSCGCRLNGQSKLPEYAPWASMLSRCKNPNIPRFSDYGGRGIKVCDRWHSFRNFLADMGMRPSPSHSLDRFPNVNGDYEPGNCRWATPREQAINRRNTIMVIYEGRLQPLCVVAENSEISMENIRTRVHKLGWTMERALTEPVRRSKNQFK